MAEDASSDLLVHLPLSLLRRLFLAAFVLLRVLSTRLAHNVEAEAGTVLFNTAVFALRRYSLETGDMAARCADILAQLWRFQSGGGTSIGRDEQEPRLYIRSRAGASVVYDSIWQWKEGLRARSWAGEADVGELPHDTFPGSVRI